MIWTHGRVRLGTALSRPPLGQDAEGQAAPQRIPSSCLLLRPQEYTMNARRTGKKKLYKKLSLKSGEKRGWEGGALLSTWRAELSQQEGENVLASSLGSGLQPGCLTLRSPVLPFSVPLEVKTLFSDTCVPNIRPSLPSSLSFHSPLCQIHKSSEDAVEPGLSNIVRMGISLLG